MSVNPLVSISTTNNVSALNTYATDAAFVNAKGSSASEGDIYVNSTWHVLRQYLNGAWVSVTLSSNSYEISNLTLTGTVVSNALTIAVKQSDGSDPSTDGGAAKIGFRNSASATGTSSQQSIISALSIVVPSSTTIGTTSGNQATIYVYALDNGGAVELAASLSLFDEGTVQSSTAISGGSTVTTLYSTSARTSKAIRLIGRMKVTEATAGTWATAPSEISLVPFAKTKSPTMQNFTSGTGTYATPSNVSWIKVRLVGGGGGGGGGGTAGSSGNGSVGGNTSFGTSLLTANGGGTTTTNGQVSGAGGSATVASPAIGTTLSGGGGGDGNGSGVAANVTGGNGGSSAFGGAGGGGSQHGTGSGRSGATNTGAGGGGGGNNGSAAANGGGGAGSGGYVDAIIFNPLATYSYAVGAAGGAGAAGTSGYTGGAGGSGYIEVTEFYNQ